MNEFQTTHLLEITVWKGLDQQYSYPFETYYLSTNFIALSSDTNASLPILSLSPLDSTDSFWPALVTQHATVINATSAGATDSPAPGRHVRIMFRRTTLTQFFVIAMLAVNWGLTLVVVYITVSAANGREVSESILVLPLSVILTIPSLRALWVDAPTLGE